MYRPHLVSDQINLKKREEKEKKCKKLIWFFLCSLVHVYMSNEFVLEQSLAFIAVYGVRW